MAKSNLTREKKIRQRNVVKNEATGIRVVSMAVQEYWECGWEPREARNDKGIDGVILLRKKGVEIGASINVQAKCGDGYVTMENDAVIRLNLGSSNCLDQHKEYWFGQVEPVVLIFTRVEEKVKGADGEILKDAKGKEIVKDIRGKPKSWWVDLRNPKVYPDDTRTIIEIDKENTFGAHSKKDFLQLALKYKSDWFAKPVIPNMESLKLLASHKLHTDAKDFYQQWSREVPVLLAPLAERVVVSRVGWRHISRSKRGPGRQNFSKKYLGIAKQIIQQAKAYTILQVKSDFSASGEKIRETRFIGIMATVDSELDQKRIVQVILMQRLLKMENEIQSKIWFYSVHERTKM